MQQDEAQGCGGDGGGLFGRAQGMGGQKERERQKGKSDKGKKGKERERKKKKKKIKKKKKKKKKKGKRENHGQKGTKKFLKKNKGKTQKFPDWEGLRIFPVVFPFGKKRSDLPCFFPLFFLSPKNSRILPKTSHQNIFSSTPWASEDPPRILR